MSLVSKFLQLADRPHVKVIEVREIGRIGIRTLSVSDVSKWNDLKGIDRTVGLIKLCVVDPDKHDAVFDTVKDSDIARLPADISEQIIYHALRHNNIVRDEKPKDEELKN